MVDLLNDVMQIMDEAYRRPQVNVSNDTAAVSITVFDIL